MAEPPTPRQETGVIPPILRRPVEFHARIQAPTPFRLRTPSLGKVLLFAALEGGGVRRAPLPIQRGGPKGFRLPLRGGRGDADNEVFGVAEAGGGNPFVLFVR